MHTPAYIVELLTEGWSGVEFRVPANKERGIIETLPNGGFKVRYTDSEGFSRSSVFDTPAAAVADAVEEGGTGFEP